MPTYVMDVYLPVDVPADCDWRADGLHVRFLENQLAHIIAQFLDVKNVLRIKNDEQGRS